MHASFGARLLAVPAILLAASFGPALPAAFGITAPPPPTGPTGGDGGSGGGGPAADTQPPVTTDNVPTTWSTTPITVTLTVQDNVSTAEYLTTTWQVLDDTGTTLLSGTYASNNKPVLQHNQQLRYSSKDGANNTETAKFSSFAKVDSQAPSTSDDAPTTTVSAAPAITLTATDALSGVASTSYQVISAGGVPGPILTYSAAAKPVLHNGESLRYFSTDVAGNIESAHTTAPISIAVPQPPQNENAGGGTGSSGAPNSPSLLPTAALTATSSGRSVLLRKGRLPVAVSCGAVACQVQVQVVVTRKGRTVARLAPRTLVLAAGERRTARLKLTAKQQGAIKRLDGKRDVNVVVTLSARTAAGAAAAPTVTLVAARPATS